MDKKALAHMRKMRSKILDLYAELRSNADVDAVLGDEARAAAYALDVLDDALVEQIKKAIYL